MSRRGDERRNIIKEAAYELFAEKGFKDVTMSDICEKSQLSRGGLYRHYSSTSEIFREIISEDISFDERIENNESAVKILTDNLNILESDILENEKSLSLAIYEYANVGDNHLEFSDFQEKAKKRWIKLIKYGISAKEFNDVNPEAIAEMILYYYQGIRMWSRVTNIGKKSAKNYKNNILDLLIKR